MNMSIQLGILLALLCAFATNLAFFYKHRGACSVCKVDIRHPLRSAGSLWSSKWFALGMVVATVGWAFHVAALAVAPLSVVQVVLAGGVVLIAVMAERLFGMPVGTRQWVGLGCMAAGLILLAVTSPSTHGAHSTFSIPAMLGFEGGLFGLGGLLIMGPRTGAPAEHHGVMLGAAAGILFGVSDMAACWPCSAPGWGWPRSPRSSPFTPRRVASKTVRRCRSSPSPARPPTSLPSRVGSWSSATRFRAACSGWQPRPWVW
jgi:drug/metabolite transporter (DMT)-like permease